MKAVAVARQQLDEAQLRTSVKDKLGARGLWLPGGALILICCVGAFFLRQSSTPKDSFSAIPTFEVQEGPLLISVLESGTISAREQRIIKSEVEGQKQITWLIPEGEHVKKGDLLVRLDSGSLEYELLTQQIAVQSAEADFIEARENSAIQKLNSESTVSAAELKAQFAAEDLTKYIEGDFPLDLKGAEAQLILAIAELASAEQDLGGRQRLFEKDFVTVRELEATERLLQKAQLDLELAESNIELLKSFTYDRRLAQLESDKVEAERALERAFLESASWVVQSKGNVTSRTSQLQHQQKKLRKIEEQIAKCEIFAPTDGMVVYATSGKGRRMGREEPLREGKMVHERQELIYLPTAKAVMARITIHESNLAKVRPGLGVRITVDALPGREFTGRVATIAQLPDAMSMYLNPDLKVYDTEIYIDGDGGELRTGMSCLARIMVERYENTVYVPVQSVVLTKAGPMVHVLKGNETEERLVDVGLDNNRMIRIASNLKAGERVLLAPPAATTTIDSNAALLETFIEAAAPPEIDHKVVKVLDTAGANGSVGRKGGMGKMTPEQMQQLRMRYENMSPEEQEKAKERLSGGGDGGVDGKGARDSDGK